MSLIVEFRLSHPNLPMMQSLAAVPAMTLEVEHERAENPQQPVIFLWASGDDFDVFETRLDEEPSIASVRVLERLDDRRFYRIQISDSAAVVVYPASLETGVSQLAVTATHRGLDLRMRFPDRERFARYREYCRDRDINVTVHRLYSSDAPQAGNEYGLSEKQCRTLKRALDEGYFMVPRQATLSELAACHDISAQSASERLRRGIATLVRNTIDIEE